MPYILSLKTGNIFKNIHLYIILTEGLSTIFIHQMPNYLSFFLKKSAFYIVVKIFNSLPGNQTILQNVKAKFKVAIRKYFFVTHLWIHGMHAHVCVCNIYVSQEHPAASERYHKEGSQKDILRLTYCTSLMEWQDNPRHITWIPLTKKAKHPPVRRHRTDLTMAFRVYYLHYTHNTPYCHKTHCHGS
jgi:hypothetical protein